MPHGDSSDSAAILSHLFRASGDAASYSSIDEWWPRFQAARGDWPVAIDQAIAGGAMADRIGYAFAAGYQAALRRMDPELPTDRMASFSVTEEGGGHPRAVKSTLTPADGGGFRLDGDKKWATLSSGGGVVLAVASTGTDDQGRNRLRVARVGLERPGVEVIRMPPTPFSPEIPHCRLAFRGVQVRADEILDGDGYEQFVKPFRTIEDLHVGVAILAYLFSVAQQYGWPHEVREEMLSVIVAMRALGLSDPRSAAVHLALEGVARTRHAILERCAAHWDNVPAEVRERWQRDAVLTGVAGAARAKRTETAWAKLASA